MTAYCAFGAEIRDSVEMVILNLGNMDDYMHETSLMEQEKNPIVPPVYANTRLDAVTKFYERIFGKIGLIM